MSSIHACATRFSRGHGATLAAMFLMLSAGGCVTNGSDGNSIPHDAEELGGGHVVSAVAPHAGTVWVYDKEADRVIYRGRVRGGDAVTVAPSADRVSVGQADVRFEGVKRLDRRHKYMVYFMR